VARTRFLKAGKDTQDFGEKWTLIKNRVLVAVEPIAMRVFNGVGRAMDVLGPKIQVLSAWFNQKLPLAIAYLQPKIEAVFGWLEVHVPPVLATIGTIIREDVVPALQRLGAWVEENLLPALQKMAASFQENIWPILRDKVIPILRETARIIVEYIVPALGKLIVFIVADVVPVLFEIVAVVVKVIDKIAEFGMRVYGVGEQIAATVKGRCWVVRDPLLRGRLEGGRYGLGHRQHSRRLVFALPYRIQLHCRCVE
jgi:hypothetical protein